MLISVGCVGRRSKEAQERRNETGRQGCNIRKRRTSKFVSYGPGTAAAATQICQDQSWSHTAWDTYKDWNTCKGGTRNYDDWSGQWASKPGWGGGLIGNNKSIVVGRISREFERVMRQCRICGIAVVRGPFIDLGYVEPLMRLAPDPWLRHIHELSEESA